MFPVEGVCQKLPDFLAAPEITSHSLLGTRDAERHSRAAIPPVDGRLPVAWLLFENT
jgi:hypothetical protein